MVRPRRGESPKARMDKLLELPLFDKLKKERPGFLESKLVAVPGDMRELNLGLSLKDRSIITKEVSIVYHVAATVLFNQPLRDAIIMNVRGTREVCELVMETRKNNPDTIFMHVSTAYAHTDQKLVEERLYPAHASWQRSIQIAESLDNNTFQILSEKYMDGFPNTYTFTKSLAEHVVNDLCGRGGYSFMMRPSIVISSCKDPIKGWIDNFNGPVAMFVALGTGIIRISYMKPDVVSDYMAVDCAIKAFIIATYKQSELKRSGTADMQNTEVYNCTAYKTKPLTMKEMSTMALDLAMEVTVKDNLWYPSKSTTDNWTWYYINFILFHLIPAVIVDAVTKTFKIKQRSLLDIQRKVFSATKALKFFMGNEWSFVNYKALALEDFISSAEMEDFGYDVENIDILDFFRNAMLGGKQYLLKESLDNLEYERKKIKVFYYLDRIVKIMFYSLTIWLVFIKWNIPLVFYTKFLNYIDNL